MTLKRIAENAANDIMDWLDIWLSRCTNSNGHEPEDLNNEEPTSRVPDETVGHNEDPSIQSSALNIYRMFDNRTDDSAGALSSPHLLRSCHGFVILSNAK